MDRNGEMLGDSGLFVTDADHVAGVQLPAAADVDLAVDAHLAGRDAGLGLTTGLDEVAELEELTETDHISVDGYVAHGHHHAGTRIPRPRQASTRAVKSAPEPLNHLAPGPELPGVRLPRIPRRACVLATAVAAGVLCTAVPAAADVTISPPTVTRGTGVNLSFRVVNDHTVAMTGVSLVLPAATPVAEVYPLSVPNWAPTITNRKLNPPMRSMHGDSLVTEVTASIAWTAAQGKAIPPKGATVLMIAIGPMPETETMTFTVQATYADGKTGPAIAPAVVTLTPAAVDPAVEEPQFDDGFDGGISENDVGFAGIAGWVIAALCAVAGGVSVVRSRRSRINTGPVKTGPAKTGPAKTGPGKTGPAKTKAGSPKIGHAEPGDATGADEAAAADEVAIAANNPADTVHRARVTAWSYRDSP
jgi:hypothetical protein